ncbi:WAT1-related protein At1g09380 [Triticum aestivum]|uniref:WAT1-related protein At1g09380 n=1 Tax=Triticum aestivum TaxID=4565 RepID=UPI001D02262A|nr:WAT1-related protein At1g09380-like [Triticum aestivum]
MALPAGMVLVQLLTVGTMLLSEVALNRGMHPLVLLVYRNLVAAVAVAPLAAVFEREMWKKVNLTMLGWISINAMFGVLLAMGLYYGGLRDTSAAYAVNFPNLIPVATFLIAVVLRAELWAERLSLSHWPGRMKLLGAAVGVAGTMVVSFCKGTHLPLPYLHFHDHAHAGAPTAAPHPHGARDMAAGTLCLCGSCISYALWFVVQTRVAKVFPSRYWATALTCAAGSLQSAAAAAVAFALTPTGDRHGWAAEWRLGWDLRLVTVVYSGVFNTGATFVLVSWAVARRGPVYPPMFNSLSLVVTAAVDAVFLGTDLYLGGFLGAALVVAGLYAFLWGKRKELAAAAKGDDREQGLRRGDTDDGIA